jgi:DNA-binding transcriptional LysR family regulator
MYTDQFRYFEFVYQVRNFSAAAKLVPMSPQGLEKAIASLEKELGAPLFFRSESGILMPSPYADEMIRFTQDWELRFRDLRESFARIRAQERREVRFCVAQGAFGLLGPDFLTSFYQKHQDITVVYKETDDESCDRALREGTVELALTVFPYDSGFVTRELASVPISLWVHGDNPLSFRPSLTFRDLKGQNLAMPGRGYKIFNYFMEQLAQQQVHLGRYHMMSELYRVYDFVRNNKGLGYGGEMLSTVFTLDPNVVTVPFEDARFRFGLSHLPAHVLTDDEQCFLDYCLRV